METEIYCPKCDSTKVTVRCLAPPRPRRISMDQLGEHTFIFEPAVLITKRYEAKCESCGYTREYSA